MDTTNGRNGASVRAQATRPDGSIAPEAVIEMPGLPVYDIQPVLFRKAEPLFLRHSRKAQTLDKGGLEQGAYLRHSVMPGGIQAR